MPVPALLDATPLSDGHSARGIGTALRGMIGALAERPPGERPALLVRRGQPAPGGFDAREVAWPRWPLHRVPDPWPAAVGERAARRLARGGVFHAVQPALVPAGRTVVTCHDLIPACLPDEYLAGPGRAAQALAYRRYLRRLARARLVLTPSAETAGDVARIAGVDPGRVRVVPWGAPAAAAPEGAPPEGHYALYSGAIEPHKNAALAVEAIARAAPGIGLVMAGPWSRGRERRLRGHAARVGAGGRVTWLGMVLAGRPGRAARRGDGGAGALAQGGLRPARAGGDGGGRAGAGLGPARAARGGRRRGDLPAAGRPGARGRRRSRRRPGGGRRRSPSGRPRAARELRPSPGSGPPGACSTPTGTRRRTGPRDPGGG